MNLQQIEYIIALDKYKSFSKAAEACHITQATLSTMVKRLEDELDVIIFDRKKNPVITTENGKAIIKEAKEIHFHIEKLKGMSADIDNKIEGKLNIGIIPTIASSLLHRILPILSEKYPKLKLIVKEITTNNILDKLKKGELDAGIVSTPIPNEELEEEILYYEKLMVYGKRDDHTSKFISPKSVKEKKVWLLEQGNCLSDQISYVCKLNKKDTDSLDFKPSSFESLLNMVDRFQGLTMIPELYYMDLPVDRQNKVIDFEPPFPVREVSFVYYRPYSKLKLIKAISVVIQSEIQPILKTSEIKNSDLLIAKM